MKEKIASLFLKISIPMIVFVGVAARCIMYGASWGDAFALLSVSAVYGYSLYLNRDNTSKYLQLNREISEIKNAITGLKVNNTVKKTYETSKEKEKLRRYF